MNKQNKTNKNMGLIDKRYEEISFTCIESENYDNVVSADSSVNFFGVSSGLRYTNLNMNSSQRR